MVQRARQMKKTYWYPMGKSLRLQSESSVSIPKQSMVMEPAMLGVYISIKRRKDGQ